MNHYSELRCEFGCNDCVCRYLGVLSPLRGDRGSTVAKVLCYNSEGRWLDPSWCQWIFHLHKIPLIALGSTQTLTEMSTSSISWGQRRPVHKADNPPPSWAVVTKSVNLTSRNPLGLSRPVMGPLYPPLPPLQHSGNHIYHPLPDFNPLNLLCSWVCCYHNKQMLFSQVL